MILKRISYVVMPPRFVQMGGEVHILANMENIALGPVTRTLVVQLTIKMSTMNILGLSLEGREGGDEEEGNSLVVITNVGITIIARNMVLASDD